MEKSTFVLVVISFGLLFACHVIEATEKNLEDETSGSLWSRPLLRADPPSQGPHKPAMISSKLLSPSQRVFFSMLPKNVPIPPSAPSRGETPWAPPHFVV
ncbi:unnamed protein product [Arabis nemorensis]|uniref:Uncharacterized protein n=1 Tax=Arabis nemorensis TaxID=586526 RepID=A0A565CHK0_9BRAS|nr:unnamed protein product [Arabis nemorensis]